MKVLVITYDFHPDNTPNTYRWFNILREWNNRGIEIYVISNQKENFLKTEICENIRIYRTSEFFLGKYKNKLRHKHEILPNQNRTSTKYLLKVIKFIYNKIWSKIYWPDFAVLWTFSTYKVAKKIIINEKVDKLITVSWPFSTHIVGYGLKKKFNHIEWLAETIDPFNFFIGVNNSFLYNRLNIYSEGKVFSLANHLTVTTDNIRNRYIQLYPELKNKLHVIKNLYVPSKLYEKAIKERNNKPLKISFFGSLILNVRTPDLTLKFFRIILSNNKYKNTELHFYGNINELIYNFNSFKDIIGKNIFLHGLISKEQVQQQIKDSDILINIGNKNVYQEPSKIFEYMYFQKPIITFTEISNDTSIQILKNYPKLFEVTNNTVNSKSLIDDFDNFVKNIDIHINEYQLSKILEPHLIETIEEDYFKILFK
jgi:hypothetical protein